MDLMKQCQVWHENEEYQRIIHAIEALPEEDQTPELASELARAYNNIADEENREPYKKAIKLLKAHEEYFQGNHSWNYRIAYAYYYLDQEGPALHYFEKALEASPGDEDTQAFINDCRRRLTLPLFKKSFRERTAESWALFEQGEAELRRLMDLKDRKARDELIAKCTELLTPALADVNYELGFNGEKYEVILSPEGSRSRLFELVYFQRHAPKSILDKWNILVGRQPSHGFNLRVSGVEQEISAQDVQVWIERGEKESENRMVSLTLYCEKLLPLLQKDPGKAWWMLSVLTDQIMGEIPVIACINGFDVTDAPKAEPGISLDELPKRLEIMGLNMSLDPALYLENNYTIYQMEAEQDPDTDWRLDVFAGSTRCPALLNEYLAGESGLMDAFHQNGAVPGFFCYPLDCFDNEEERGKAVLDFRDALEEAVMQKAGQDAVIFLGGATGIYCGYLDFIAWDLRQVLDAAARFFQDSPVPWASFHTFRRNVSTVSLKEESTEEAANSEEGEGSKAEGEFGEEPEQDGNKVGCFISFVLLEDANWNKEQFIQDMKEDWDVDASEEEDDDTSPDTIVFSVGNIMAAVSLMPAPVPNKEAEENAANNYMWPEAVETAKAHQAHLVVAVLGQDAPLLERGKLFTKVTASCCKQKNATGVYTSGTVFEPRFYQAFADMMKEDDLPIFNWIWFGLYRSEEGVCGYTYGMEAFGKDEMEVLDADAEPSEVRDFLADMVSYVLESDVTLQDGETIGFSEEQKLPITRSQGVSLPGITLKIGYGLAN